MNYAFGVVLLVFFGPFGAPELARSRPRVRGRIQRQAIEKRRRKISAGHAPLCRPNALDAAARHSGGSVA
ncbi:hypothetical protein B5E60_09780 [Alistipes sp. An116]|nr:hypothetical protein B5E60_09780 [Alistipes sp. An116]